MTLVFKDTVLTNKGFNISNKAALGKTQFSIIKAVSTDYDLTNYKIEDLKNLTSLPNEIDSGTLTDYDAPENSISVIKLNFDNSKFKQGYTVRAIGLYGQDSDNNLFLHSLTVSDTPIVIPEVTGNIFDGLNHSITIFSGDNHKMNVDLEQQGAASVHYVDQSLEPLKSKANIMYQYRGKWDDNLLNIGDSEDGYYSIFNNKVNAPDDFNGYGSLEKISVGSDIMITLKSNDNHIWINHLFNGLAKWSGWVSQDDRAINYANQLNIDSKSYTDKRIDKAYQSRGDWFGPLNDWGDKKDGIYTVHNVHDSAPYGFTGWGVIDIKSSDDNADKYGVLHDNNNHMFRNHLFVGAGYFSGWIQY